MFAIGVKVREVLSGMGIIAGCFHSKDGSLGRLQALYQEANLWLKSRPVKIKCCVSLHSDSGDFSHVFGIYGRDDGRMLAANVMGQVGDVFGLQRLTLNVRSFRFLGQTDYSTYLFNTQVPDFPTVLIECGSHVNDHDRAILTDPNGQQAIAEAVVEGIRGWGLQFP